MSVHVDLDEIEEDAEPSVVFTLAGRDWHCRSRSAVPAVIVDHLLGNTPMRVDQFYRGLLCPTIERDGKTVNQVDEFLDLLVQADSPVTLERVTRLMEALAEAVLNRPTRRSGPSGRGPLPTGDTSKAGSSSKGGSRRQRAS